MAADDGVKIGGLDELRDQMRELVPNLRRGPALRALRLGAKPVLDRAYAETPVLKAPIFRGKRMIRKPGVMRDSLRIRTSKDTAKTGDVGVFINYKPLERSAITAFKNDTGRKASENYMDNFYWRFIIFATKTNKNPRPALQNAGKIMPSVSLPIIIESLKGYFERLNARIRK